MSEPIEEAGVLRISVRTAAIMLAFTVVFTALMAGTYKLPPNPWSRPAPWRRKLRLIGEVLPRRCTTTT
jgi:hypothetical protein